jgi:thiamine biosynthesis protein ThiI
LDNVILIRIGELWLKGKNRVFFENLLVKNIKEKLADVECKLYFGRNRYVVSDYAAADENIIVKKLQTVFGVTSLSAGRKTRADFESIRTLAEQCAKTEGSFRVNVNRADKTFPLSSPELAGGLGAALLQRHKNLRVDLHNPDFVINVDIREDGGAYIFSDRYPGAGGMPVGSAGRGLLLLSGGIDSPVAGYMTAKRGMAIDALHFHSYPYTSADAKEKVRKLAAVLQNYCGRIRLYNAAFTKIQEAINGFCDGAYTVTVMRRLMLRAAKGLAEKNGYSCLINGESLGQVASQTIQSITVTNAVAGVLPVLRPLIGMDKSEITDAARKIGTYGLSVLPFEDCCTVFLPKNPVTKPTLARCEAEERKIPGLDGLIGDVLNNLEVVKVDSV